MIGKKKKKKKRAVGTNRWSCAPFPLLGVLAIPPEGSLAVTFSQSFWWTRLPGTSEYHVFG
jgi:hypothetical protein